MTEYLIKSPAETRACAIAWPGLREGESLACCLGWTVTPEDGDDGLRLREGPLGRARSEARIEGGRAGHLYHVAHRVRTSEGRALSRAFLLRVVER